MDSLLDQFPTHQTINDQAYRSFIFQPDRISVNSRQSLLQANVNDKNTQPDFYFQFSNELRSPLLRVKQLELLRATIPNAVTSIPITQGIFFYYRIPATNAPAEYAPDYSLIEPVSIHMVRLLPQEAYNPDNYENASLFGYNKTFADYEDLVSELNKSTQEDPDFNYQEWEDNTAYPEDSYVLYLDQVYYSANGSAGTATFNTDDAWVLQQFRPFIPGDITFSFNATLNKIVVKGNNAFDDINQIPQYYYLPVGYADINLPFFIQSVITQTAVIKSGGTVRPFTSQEFPTNLPYTLNRRIGFLWAGIFNFDNNEINKVFTDLVEHTFPAPNWQETVPIGYNPFLPNYTAEGYADLVNTGNVYLYCDFVGGSTQDTNSEERLLAVVPMNASNLGIVFGESKIVCPLSKVSENVYQINITMRTDTAEPFILPTNAYVNLELKLTY